MIFVTVGSELPFDRLVNAVDRWARENHRSDVFAQIGEHGKAPDFIPSTRFLDPAEFKQRFSTASIIVAHAGMGTILSALCYAKPILVMPRLASLGEARNEHQLATARQMLKQGKVDVAFDERELARKLDALTDLRAPEHISPYASDPLIGSLRHFIHARSA